jgi:hypothetical protein
MLFLEPSIVHLLRQPPGRPQGQQTPEAGTVPGEQPSPNEEPFIICRECRHPITRPSERISVQGQHHHTFANPHGIVFEIGCFSKAPGCGYIGPATDEFAWFAGHRWQVCICAACLSHIGWLFTTPSGEAFHGLIIDHLIEPSR